ncbi:GFRA1 protein, partial [Polypterus senegalus]
MVDISGSTVLEADTPISLEPPNLTEIAEVVNQMRVRKAAGICVIRGEVLQVDGEPAITRENTCLNAAKACNLNDTCKKYRSAYVTPCTTRVSNANLCNKRKCHKALRQFFDKVPPKHSYGLLFCSCPPGDQAGCMERRRQTIVPICSYDDKEKPNCLSLQVSCKTNYMCK